MCTYNGEQYLREQLDSIATQTRLPDELIVCDDRSNDDTTEIIKAFATKAPFRVHLVINEKNLGVTKNFEKAIKLCQGDIIALSDQDDVWHPEKLMRIEAVFSNLPRTGVVFTDAEVVDEYLRPLGYRLWHAVGFSRAEQRQLIKGRAFRVLVKHNVVTGATMAFRSEFKGLILPIPESWVHDAWIALIIAAFADLTPINEPLIKYRQHSNNQIGAAKKGFGEQLSQARKMNSSSFYLNEADLFALVRERLLAVSVDSYCSDMILELEAKIHHMYSRAMIRREPLINRLFLIFKELVTLRYHRYSGGGWKSLAKDLFLARVEK